MNNDLRTAAAAQAKKFAPKIVPKSKVSKGDLDIKPSSLENLITAFEDEKFVIFDINGTETTFHIKMMDPGLLLVETGTPLYVNFAVKQAGNPNFMESLSDSDALELLKAEHEHKRRVLATCVISPKLRLEDEPKKGEENSFPIARLPLEIVNSLYEIIMGTIDEGQDLLDNFPSES